MAKTAPKRKYISRKMLVEAIRKDRLEHPNKSVLNRVAKPPRRTQIRHRVLSSTTTVEMRTGSGVTRRIIECTGERPATPGVIRQTKSGCNPRILHCTDGFYGRIDRDLREWQFQEDLKLRVPYAVKRWKKQKAYERKYWKLIREDAKRRGLV